MDSPFEVLRIDEDADESEIEQAYRRRVKESHPDQGGSTAEFLRVRRAYEQLTSDDGGERRIADPADGRDGPDRDADDTRRGDEDGDGDGDADGAGSGDRGRGRDDGRGGPGAGRGPGSDPGRRGRDDGPGGRERRGGRSGGDGDATRGGGNEEPAAGTASEGARVEYLDYEVLADLGWGLDDDDLFEKAAGAGLDPDDYGRLLVEPREFLLEAAEHRGFAWPYACRGGACANCAVAVVEGEMTMPPGHILPQEMLDRGIRLSCVCEPITEEAKVIFNVKHLPGLDELRLPADRFERERASD